MMDSLRVGLGWVLITIAVLGLPLAEFKPNRVLAGVPVYGSDVFGQIGIGLVVALLLTVAMLVLVYKEKRHCIAGTTAVMLMMVPGALLLLMNQVVLPEVITDPSTLRVSLGSGFWLLCVGAVLFQSGLKGFKWAMAVTLVLCVIIIGFGGIPALSLYKEALTTKQQLLTEFGRHLTLAFSSVLLAMIPGVLMGYWSYKTPQVKGVILSTVNFFQVIPTLSLLGLLMIPLTILSQSFPILGAMGIRGIGFAPAFIVLTLYCLLPITANALAGFKQVNQAVIDSALAMGMNRMQLFWRVLLPLAAPVILSGIRTAVTQNIGNTILAGLIGGGGMGALIFLGLSQSATDLVILATLPVVLLAYVADKVFEWIEQRLIGKVGTHHDTASEHP